MSEIVRPRNGAKFDLPPGFGHFDQDDVAARQLPRQAGHTDQEGVLYVLAFDNDLTKVGRSASPQQRVDGHVGNLRRCAGAGLVRGWLSVPHANHQQTERMLIGQGRHWARATEGNEHLFGVDFDRLVRFAVRLTFLPPVQGPRRRQFTDDLVEAANRTLARLDHGTDESAEQPIALPPPLGPEDEEGLLPLVRSLASALAISEKDAGEMSWLDLYERLLKSKAETYRLELEAQFHRTRTRIYTDQRWDLTDPLVSYDTWCGLDSSVPAPPKRLALVEPAS